MTTAAVTPAFASEIEVTEAGGTGNSKVTFEVVNSGSPEDPTIFSAYVSSVLPIKINLDGEITVPENAMIRNGVDDRAIQVEGVTVTTTVGWQHTDMSTAANGSPDSHLLGLELNGQDLTNAAFPWKIEAAGSLDLNMKAEIPQQTSASDDEQIATVAFTLDFEEDFPPADTNPSDGLILSEEEAAAMGFTFSSYEDGLQIDGFDDKQSKTEVNVPEQIGDLKVLKINHHAFEVENDIQKITLPSTLKEISFYAFYGCSSLASINLPNNITVIGDSAFEHCSGLTSITLPDSLIQIGIAAFYGCLNLASLAIPDSVINIGSAAFESVSHIEYHGTATGAPWGAKSMN